MSEPTPKPIILTQRSRTVSEASNQSETKSSTAEDDVDVLALSGDEQSPNSDEVVAESEHGGASDAGHDETEDQVGPSNAEEVAELSEGEEEEEENVASDEEAGHSMEEVDITADPEEGDETIDAAEETTENVGDTEAVDPANLSADAQNCIKMFQQMSSNPNVDNYDYEADEAVYPVESFPLPFDDMRAFQQVLGNLSLGEKRYIVDYIKTSYETMQAEARRIKGQLRAINARSGRLRMQIKREETAAKSGIDPDKVPRSSKGIGKKFTEQ